MNKYYKILLTFILISSFSCAGVTKKDTDRFTFSRQFEKGSLQAPRGGITKGPGVKLVKSPSPEWEYLREDGITVHERDRRAILAMAGDYRASFEFVETVPFLNDYSFDSPYQSWATERIYVLEDSENFISLQHILVMFFIEDGKTVGPMVVKHWRQDWTYEPGSYHEYKGNNIWAVRNVTVNESGGKWVQEVFHVDDSPRYASIGQWEHTDNFSQWSGNRTFRPLPRREFSVRSDYDVLDGENRHIIVPTGWVHEQENLKLRLNEDVGKEYIAKEIGLNRYDRIEDFDFTGGDEYWEKTKDYWKVVRDTWAGIYEINDRFVFVPRLENKSLISKQFEFADGYQGGMSQKDLKKHAEAIIFPHINQ